RFGLTDRPPPTGRVRHGCDEGINGILRLAVSGKGARVAPLKSLLTLTPAMAILPSIHGIRERHKYACAACFAFRNSGRFPPQSAATREGPLTEQAVDVKTADGVADSYVFYPDGPGSWPAVIFFMDGLGIRPEMH